MDHCYRDYYANMHRGVYTIAEEATAAYEAARAQGRRASSTRARPTRSSSRRNATEAINLVAYTWARANLHAGDVDRAHAHGAPRQRRAVAHARRRARRRAALDPADRRLPARPLRPRPPARRRHAARGHRDVERARHHQRHPPARRRRARRRRAGARRRVPSPSRTSPPTCRRGTPTSSRSPAHKMLGPSGIGALWARAELLEAMPPFLGGGEMIRDVRLDGFTTNDVPWKFEAGTPPIAEAVGFGAAVDYLDGARHGRGPRPRDALTGYALDALRDRFGDRSRSTARATSTVRGGAVSFLFDGIHAHDISQVLDEDGVCVRAGHHCAKPLMRAARRPGDDPGVVLRLQRRGRRRRARRGARQSREVLHALKRR